MSWIRHSRSPLRLQWLKPGSSSRNDELRIGRPKTTTTPGIIEKVYHIVLNDRRVKVREVANIMGISNKRVNRTLLTRELRMKNTPHVG